MHVRCNFRQSQLLVLNRTNTNICIFIFIKPKRFSGISLYFQYVKIGLCGFRTQLDVRLNSQRNERNTVIWDSDRVTRGIYLLCYFIFQNYNKDAQTCVSARTCFLLTKQHNIIASSRHNNDMRTYTCQGGPCMYKVILFFSQN